MISCPRCRAEREDCRLEWEGREEGVVVWTVYHCNRCSFTWRDTEPDRSIKYEARKALFRVDPDRPEQYRYNIPPAAP